MNPRYSVAPAAAYRDPRLTPVAKALVGLLGAHNEKNGWIHPKQTELAESIGVSREYISRTLRTLVQLGYVETRSFTEARRGRVALEYRVRADLSDEMVQAAEISRCEPDVISSSHRLDKSLKTADVIQSSQRGRCDLQFTSVIESPLRGDKLSTKNKHFPENFVEAWERWPQRGRSSKRKSAEAWAKANREHAPALVLSAFDAYLASADAQKDAGQYVPAFERWLRDKLETWIELAASRPAPVDQRAERERIWREQRIWNPKWGPAPEEPESQQAQGGES